VDFDAQWLKTRGIRQSVFLRSTRWPTTFSGSDFHKILEIGCECAVVNVKNKERHRRMTFLVLLGV